MSHFLPSRSLFSSRSVLSSRSVFSSRSAAFAAVFTVALAVAPALPGQDIANPVAAPAQAPDQTLSNTPAKKQKVDKADRIQQTKDTKAADKKEKKLDPLVGKDATLPDKQLYDKAEAQIKSGHYDVGRLDLQTLLNTYPDSQYQMRAKLAVADAWYKEGGAAALTQAEQEYKDFITFFPNVPEAAEAQLRVGDIYFKQMDIPDRDYDKGMHAEAEYRTMLKQYPDAPKALLEETRQKLREVQEVLATREASLGAFYASHNNWAAAIARYQTVIDTYPLYSHMDDVLIGVGDAYEAQANIARATPVCTPKNILVTACLSEAAKATLLTEYDGKAAQMYRAVVLDHSAAPHVEDAKERLAGMDLPVPTPTKQQVAASEALESSRAQYNLKRRMEIFFLHRPDTVTAAQIGDPPLEDAPPTYAPAVAEAMRNDYVKAFNPAAASATHAATATATPDTSAAPAVPAAPAAPLAFSDVAPAEGNGAVSNSKTVTISPVTGASGSSMGAPSNGLGVEVLGSSTGDTTPEAAPRSSASTPPSDLPSATGKQDPNFGLPTVAPKDASALPAVEKPADAPDQVNDAAGQKQPAVTQAKGKNGKPVKDPLDKTDESSSKKKPKKGLDKLNPFPEK
jgi:outer membrane protein assembly factor BamD